MAGKVNNNGNTNTDFSKYSSIDDLLANAPKEMDEQQMMQFQRQMTKIQNAANMIMKALESQDELAKRATR